MRRENQQALVTLKNLLEKQLVAEGSKLGRTDQAGNLRSGNKTPARPFGSREKIKQNEQALSLSADWKVQTKNEAARKINARNQILRRAAAG
jgi:hypothetical protein